MTLSTDDDGPMYRLHKDRGEAALTLTRRDGDMSTAPTGSIAFRDAQEAMDVAQAILDALKVEAGLFAGYDLSLHG